jgi:hypothetical protein
VFLSNQFWKHKYHLLVVGLLRLLTARSRPTTVAVTRMQSGPRNPRHFVAVEAAITRAGVQQEFLLLGMLPYRHLGPLACGCLALGNSAHAKRSSTKVEEAQALCIPVPLSDLALYGEQVVGATTYFDRFSTSADALTKLRPIGLDERARCGRQAMAEAHSRTARFAAEFVALVRHTQRAR